MQRPRRGEKKQLYKEGRQYMGGGEVERRGLKLEKRAEESSERQVT